MTTGTEAYYARRAREYDTVYDKPERQADLARLRTTVQQALAARRVCEVAAGTGYWTAAYADGAASVVATDVNAEVLDVARTRRRWPPTVRFEVADAFALDGLEASVAGAPDAAFAAFLWSHIDLNEIDGFLAGLARVVPAGSLVLLVDNLYVEGSNHPITRTDDAGNTYQQRTLTDGSPWEVRKNFPTEREMRVRLERIGDHVETSWHGYFWWATVRTIGSGD